MRERWHKTKGNYAYHFEQSFAPEEVTPEEAYQCGLEFAMELFANEGFQVVFGTHLDRAHLHNHFAVNAVNMTNGKKLDTNHDFIRRMREANDRVCRAHGLSVIEHPNGKGKSYAEWIIDKNGGFTWRGAIRQDIDSLLSETNNLRDLLDKLRENGYSIKTGKHIAVSPPGTNTFFRLYKLGRGYTEEDLVGRILNIDPAVRLSQRLRQDKMQPIRVKRFYLKGIFRVLKRKRGFITWYYIYLHRLRKILNVPAGTRRKMPVLVRRDSKQLNNFIDDWRLLHENRIDKVFQLAEFNLALSELKQDLCEQRTVLRAKLQTTNPAELEPLHTQITNLNSEIQKVKKQMATCNRIYEHTKTVNGITKEFKEIQKGMIDNGGRSRSDRHCGKDDTAGGGILFSDSR